jgi:hypothetical protein
MSYQRKQCCFPGCGMSGRNKGFHGGKRFYGTLCERHYREKHLRDVPPTLASMKAKQAIPNSACSVCGWDKAPCDRHRIDPSKGYTAENVKVLCPNCHRLEHLGLLYLATSAVVKRSIQVEN